MYESHSTTIPLAHAGTRPEMLRGTHRALIQPTHLASSPCHDGSVASDGHKDHLHGTRRFPPPSYPQPSRAAVSVGHTCDLPRVLAIEYRHA